jgi:hypothetical protein
VRAEWGGSSAAEATGGEVTGHKRRSNCGELAQCYDGFEPRLGRVGAVECSGGKHRGGPNNFSKRAAKLRLGRGRYLGDIPHRRLPNLGGGGGVVGGDLNGGSLRSGMVGAGELGVEGAGGLDLSDELNGR